MIKMKNDKIIKLYFECTDSLYGYWKDWTRWSYIMFVKPVLKE